MADESGKSMTTTGGGGDSALQSDQGSTSIADAVVTKIAGIATREVAGVHNLGGGTARRIGSMTQAVGLGDERTQGVSVEVGEKQAAVDLIIVVEYGESIPKVAESVRKTVAERIEGMTGLNVTEVNIVVNDLHFAGDDEQEEQEEPARVE